VVIETVERGKEAGKIYLDKLAPLPLQIKRLHKLESLLNEAAGNNAIELAEGLKAGKKHPDIHLQKAPAKGCLRNKQGKDRLSSPPLGFRSD